MVVAGCSACILCTCLLRLLVGLQDAEASTCPPPVIHKEVGDTVELPSCSSDEKITKWSWNYKDRLIADNLLKNYANEFGSRMDFNIYNFSLTLRKLNVQDSGDFQFISFAGLKQRHTVTVTLQVHEPITEEPILTSQISWPLANGSCTVHLQCRAPKHHHVTYSWTAGNETINGSQVYDTWMDQEEGATFTCTTSNFVSSRSASTQLFCSTGHPGDLQLTLIVAAAGSLFLILILILIGSILCVRRRRKSRSAEGDEAPDATLYADITEITSAVEASSKAPASLYATLENRKPPVMEGQTVYDQIRLSRMIKALD